MVVEGRTVDMAEVKAYIADLASAKNKSVFPMEVLTEAYEGATVFRDVFPLNQG